MSSITLSASLQCMDFSNMRTQFAILNEVIDRYHFDVGDGVYVRNMVFGPEVIRGMEPLMTLPFDVHLALRDPDNLLDAFMATGASTLCFHLESVAHEFFRLVKVLREHKKGVGIVLNPLTGIETVPYFGDVVERITVMTVDPGFRGQPFIHSMFRKIEALRALRDREGFEFAIEADGNVGLTTIPQLYAAGADTMILGTTGLFRHDVPLDRAVEELKACRARVAATGQTSP